jgi:IclR family transcriptional regulator, acetate operon repressor
VTTVQSSSGTVRSVQRALKLMNIIASMDSPPQAKDLADTLGLPLPTTFHLLKTLVDAGYLVKESRTYRLGPEIPKLSAALERAYAIPGWMRESLARLAYESGETANICRWLNHDVEIAAVAEGRNAVRVAGHAIGLRGNAHARAAGKVILAFGPAFRREQYFGHPLAPLTPSTICSVPELEKELDVVAQQGYALDYEEFIPGVCCVAAPIRDADTVSTAIAVTVPADRFRQTKDELVERVVAAANIPDGI